MEKLSLWPACLHWPCRCQAHVGTETAPCREAAKVPACLPAAAAPALLSGPLRCSTRPRRAAAAAAPHKKPGDDGARPLPTRPGAAGAQDVPLTLPQRPPPCSLGTHHLGGGGGGVGQVRRGTSGLGRVRASHSSARAPPAALQHSVPLPPGERLGEGEGGESSGPSPRQAPPFAKSGEQRRNLAKQSHRTRGQAGGRTPGTCNPGATFTPPGSRESSYFKAIKLMTPCKEEQDQNRPRPRNTSIARRSKVRKSV